MRRTVAVTVAALASLPVLAGTAHAAPADMDAPYARAAAKVHHDATLLAGKNIESVTRGGLGTIVTGVYCVKVSDPEIDLANAAINATLNNDRGEITAIGNPHAYCSSATDTITVVTSDSSGNQADRPFTVTVQ